MNRRAFFHKTVGALAAAMFAPKIQQEWVMPCVMRMKWRSKLWVSAMYPVENMKWSNDTTSLTSVRSCLINRPETCATCPLHTKSVPGFVPDRVALHPKWALCGEAPGKQEISQGEPFIGKAGFVLDSWLIKAVPALQLAKEAGQVTYMNTLRCLPPEHQGRAYPKGAEKLAAEAHCRQYDPDMTPYETVVLFGESPQRAWFGAELEAEDAMDRQLKHDLKGVLGRIGRVMVKDGKRYVFAPHPAYILRQPAFVEHGQAALRIAAGTDQELMPDYKPWYYALGEM